MRKLSKWRIFKIIWFTAVAMFLIWNWWTLQSRGLPAGTFLNKDGISVTEDSDQILFRPDSPKSTLEVIFFQGGAADPSAYAPLCRELALNGFTCHLIKMAWRLPQFDYQKVIRMFDLSNGNYVVGGHSQGAKMAAQIVYENPAAFKGLFLMGTVHPRDINLSGLTLPTLKLYGENDGLASVPEVLENKGKLPMNTKLVLVKGANHSQFGYLGKILLDGEASITRESQQTQTLQYLTIFLKGIK